MMNASYVKAFTRHLPALNDDGRRRDMRTALTEREAAAGYQGFELIFNKLYIQNIYIDNTTDTILPSQSFAK